MVKIIASGRVRTIIARPGYDDICRCCPHKEYECAAEHLGPRGLAAAEFDRRTLRALKLKLGHAYPLPEVDERIARLTPEAFQAICQGCEWQRLGTCRRGHQALRERFQIVAAFRP